MLDSDIPITKPTSSQPNTTNLPWVEKYRPRVLSDVVGNEDAINKLKAISKQGNLPNLIISGPPGTFLVIWLIMSVYSIIPDILSDSSINYLYHLQVHLHYYVHFTTAT